MTPQTSCLRRAFVILGLALLGASLAASSPAADPAQPMMTLKSTTLSNEFVELTIRGASVTSLKTLARTVDFMKDLKPEFWRETADTQIKVDGTTAVIAPLEDWRVDNYGTPPGTDTPVPISPGQTLGQTFRIPEGVVFSEVGVRLPTWHSKTSAVTVTVSHAGKPLASRRIENVDQNAWQVVPIDAPQGAGDYLVAVSDAVGQIGWWTSEKDIHGHAEALAEGKPVTGDRAIQITGRRLAGTGKLAVALEGRTMSISAVLAPTSDASQEKFPWVWKTTWKKDGYDCSPEAGVLFKRMYTDTLSYLPVEQLKRRPHVAKGGLRFVSKDWIEMDGTADADLRVSGSGLSMSWDMTADEMAMSILSVPRREADGWHAGLKVEVKYPDDAMPAEFPRFETSDPELTQDLNRLWWERGLSFSAPAQPTIVWADWMSLMWGWFAGPPRDAEMANIVGYPMTPEGYMHTWGAEVGWPLVRDGRDTRHFETNARYILGCWRHFLFTGDMAFLRSQEERLRKTMSYQLETLRGKEGLVVTPEFKTGRHQDLSNNYWDVLPFGHLDAYANISFYASITAMEQMQKALGTAPLTDYAKLRELAHRRYDEAFWNDEAGRYIGCVDIDGARHDYGFTFINLEALHYGLGDESKAKRIYQWMETEPTSSGKADTYTKWIFAPRTTTIHNPMWGPKAPKSETDNLVKPWWTYWWPGTPFGEQCQDGGAIFYTSFFDLMNRSRTFGAENAWKRYQEILARYRMPDRLCGGNPLFLGEIAQQEDGGAVGTDYPFPESGLVPLYFLYGVIGLDPKPDALHITPRLPKVLEFAAVSDVSWRGAKLRIRVMPTTVKIDGTAADGSTVSLQLDIKLGETAVLNASDISTHKN
jgi:hypothetical protein